MSTAAEKAIERGRMALEALQSREQAAKFHAAAMELRIAISDAESGNGNSVSEWLTKHHDMISDFPDLVPSLPKPHFAAVETPEVKRPKMDEERPTLNESPWRKMIEGAKKRALVSKTSPQLHPLLHSDLRNETTSIVDDIKDEISSDADTETIEDNRSGFAVPTMDAELKSERVFAPPALQLALDNERVDQSKKDRKKLLWLSPSLLGSTIAHLVAVAGMSFYVIKFANKTEPKSIVASTADTQEVSMEAPMEFSASEAQLDTSEPTVPTLPSFAAQPTESTSSSIQLPTAMMGVGLPSSPTTAREAVEQATAAAATSDRIPTNAAQFFGVKAAGNTFCYVVDASPSMRDDNAFAAAKSELVRSLSSFKPKQRYHISFFAKEIVDLSLDGRTPEAFPVYATPENIQKTIAWIEQVRVQPGGKAPNEVLEKAIGMDPDGIFLLFDGDTTVDVAAFLRKTNRSNDIITGEQPLVPIHTLGFYNEDHQAVMKKIAQENLGTFRFVPNPNKMK